MDDIVKESLRRSDICIIDQDASMSLRSLKINEINKSHDILYEDSTVKILNAKGLDRHVNIKIPGYLKKQMGIIEDRVKYSLSMALEAAKYGIVYHEKNPFCTVRALKTARKTHKSLEDTIENLGCIVLQQT